MKKLFGIVCLLLLAVVVFAEDLTYIYLSGTANTNGATAITTNTWDTRVSGQIEAIYMNLGGTASQTCDVDIVTTSAGAVFQTARTLFSTNSVTANAYLPMRLVEYDNTGAFLTGVQYARNVLFSDIVQARFTNAGTTGVTMRVTIVLYR